MLGKLARIRRRQTSRDLHPTCYLRKLSMIRGLGGEVAHRLRRLIAKPVTREKGDRKAETLDVSRIYQLWIFNSEPEICT